jgi:hypothetical protein
MTMNESVRRALVLDDLILGVQKGLLTPSEKGRAIWLLNATDWKIQGVGGIATDLLNKLLNVSPLLRMNAPPTATTDEPKSVERSPAVPTLVTYGFTKPE